jgi:hypothetical protein
MEPNDSDDEPLSDTGLVDDDLQHDGDGIDKKPYHLMDPKEKRK